MSFNHLFAQKKKLFIPFFILGYPTIEKSFELIKAAIDAGCKAIELGIPFTDATADGPVIQQASLTALKNNATFDHCLAVIKKIRNYSDCTMSLLVYANLIYPDKFSKLHALQAAGVDAILTVDIPLNENKDYQTALTESKLEACYLIAPNTEEKRIQEIMQHVEAYAYLIADYGTTGVRTQLANSLQQRINQIRNISTKPLVVGFGVHEPSQAKTIFGYGADGVIVGSALVKLIQQNPDDAVNKVFDYVKSFTDVIAND